MKTRKQLVRDLAGVAALAIAAAAVGLGANRLREKPLPLAYHSKAARVRQAVETIAQNSPAPEASTNAAPAAAPRLLSLDDFKQCVERTNIVILDARPEVFHRLGHVPRALSLPRNDFEAAYARLKPWLTPDRTIAVYCSDSDCEDSQMVADALVKLGCRHVGLFKGGWADWTAAQLPEEKSP